MLNGISKTSPFVIVEMYPSGKVLVSRYESLIILLQYAVVLKNLFHLENSLKVNFIYETCSFQ